MILADAIAKLEPYYFLEQDLHYLYARTRPNAAPTRLNVHRGRVSERVVNRLVATRPLSSKELRK